MIRSIPEIPIIVNLRTIDYRSLKWRVRYTCSKTYFYRASIPSTSIYRASYFVPKLLVNGQLLQEIWFIRAHYFVVKWVCIKLYSMCRWEAWQATWEATDMKIIWTPLTVHGSMPFMFLFLQEGGSPVQRAFTVHGKWECSIKRRNSAIDYSKAIHHLSLSTSLCLRYYTIIWDCFRAIWSPRR